MIRTVSETTARHHRKTIRLAFRMNGTKKTRTKVCSKVSDSYVLLAAKTLRGNSDLCLAFQVSIERPPPFWRHGQRSDRPASAPTGVCPTPGGLTLGVRARNAAHIACLLNGSCKSATSTWVLVYRRISLLRFPPFSVLVSFLSPSVFPASLLVSPPGLKIPPVTITNRRRGGLLPAAPCLVSANTADGGADAARIRRSERAGAATEPLELLTVAPKYPGEVGRGQRHRRHV